MVIFGGGGDLTKRLVVPALYNLSRNGLLPEQFAVVSVDGADIGVDTWLNNLHASMKSFVATRNIEMQLQEIDDKAWSRLTDFMHYISGDFTSAATYQHLAEQLPRLAEQYGIAPNVLFYLATPERFFGEIIDHLGAEGLADEDRAGGWRRVVIEKPFGHDLASAMALNARIGKVLREDQIFRIDHFLGKETVQNILAFRFANGLFEPSWNRDRIDHVQITAAETVGVEGRGAFYEQTGCLRDMVPNHLFQLLAMVAMEAPSSFDAEAIRQRKAEVIEAIRPIQPTDAVRGQYGPGAVNQTLSRAYRDEPNVAPDSGTETYVALKVNVDTWRWAGVPFYLRTGKHMGRRTTEIAIRFKSAPIASFRSTGVDAFGPDWLVLQIQPDEGISLQFDVKKPGPKVALAPVRMDFKYADWFPSESNVGYETLLYDCMLGDATLFQRADMVEACWQAVQPILEAWAKTPAMDFPNYASGSAGPSAADTLLAISHGHAWRPLGQPLLPYGSRGKAVREAEAGKAKSATASAAKPVTTRKSSKPAKAAPAKAAAPVKSAVKPAAKPAAKAPRKAPARSK
ncbi:glucose-6-phosphate dehydrogenase [Frateuria aurantia]